MVNCSDGVLQCQWHWSRIMVSLTLVKLALPIPTTPVKLWTITGRYQWHQQSMISLGINNTGNACIAGVIGTGELHSDTELIWYRISRMWNFSDIKLLDNQLFRYQTFQYRTFQMLDFSDTEFFKCRTFQIRIFQITNFSGNKLFRYQTFQITNFLDTKLSDTELFRYQIFQIPNFSDTKFFRYQTFQILSFQ